MFAWNHKDSPYALLGLKQRATAEEVKAAWRRLAKRHHPDRARGNEDKMAMINAAYDLLSDAKRRREYDRFYVARCATCGGTGSVKSMAGFKIVKKRCPDCSGY